MSSMKVWDQQLKDIEIKWLEDIFQKSCEENGGPGAYDAIKEISRYFVTGKNLVSLNHAQFQAELGIAFVSGQLDVFAKKFCHKIPNLERHNQYIADSVITCLKPEQQENVCLNLNISKAIQEFICLHEGEPITKFLISDGLKGCIVSEYKALHNCITRNLIPLGGLEGYLFFSGPNVCTKINEMLSCISHTFAECKDQTAATITNDLISYLGEVASCGRFAIIANTTLEAFYEWLK